MARATNCPVHTVNFMHAYMYYASCPTRDSYQLVLDGKFVDSHAWTYAESIASFDRTAWQATLDAETFVDALLEFGRNSDTERALE